jgi:hypothetical protein
MTGTHIQHELVDLFHVSEHLYTANTVLPPLAEPSRFQREQDATGNAWLEGAFETLRPRTSVLEQERISPARRLPIAAHSRLSRRDSRRATSQRHCVPLLNR